MTEDLRKLPLSVGYEALWQTINGKGFDTKDRSVDVPGIFNLPR